MATKKIQKGDMVKVIAGKDKGKSGKVILTKGNKVLVEGVNEVTKHTKASAANPKGGIVKQEALIDVSNVMYLHKGEPARIQFEVTTVNKDGKEKRSVSRLAKVAGKPAEKIK